MIQSRNNLSNLWVSGPMKKIDILITQLQTLEFCACVSYCIKYIRTWVTEPGNWMRLSLICTKHEDSRKKSEMLPFELQSFFVWAPISDLFKIANRNKLPNTFCSSDITILTFRNGSSFWLYMWCSNQQNVYFPLYGEGFWKIIICNNKSATESCNLRMHTSKMSVRTTIETQCRTLDTLMTK